MASDDDFDQDAPDEDAPVKARTSILTIILCILNVLAAVAFTYLLMLDYKTRQAWSYSIFMHDLKVVGLPLEEELDEGTSSSRLIMPKQKLDGGQLQAAHSKRGGK